MLDELRDPADRVVPGFELRRMTGAVDERDLARRQRQALQRQQLLVAAVRVFGTLQAEDRHVDLRDAAGDVEVAKTRPARNRTSRGMRCPDRGDSAPAVRAADPAGSRRGSSQCGRCSNPPRRNALPSAPHRAAVDRVRRRHKPPRWTLRQNARRAPRRGCKLHPAPAAGYRAPRPACRSVSRAAVADRTGHSRTVNRRRRRSLSLRPGARVRPATARRSRVPRATARVAPLRLGTVPTARFPNSESQSARMHPGNAAPAFWRKSPPESRRSGVPLKSVAAVAIRCDRAAAGCRPTAGRPFQRHNSEIAEAVP